MRCTVLWGVIFVWGMLWFGWSGAGSAVQGNSPPFEVGTATTDITPPLDFPISGYYNERLSTGVLDPLLAKTLVFRQQERIAALVICDVISLPQKLTDAMRDRAAFETGIPREAILITATHTHTGPLFGNKSADYETQLVEKITDLILRGKENLRSATLESGTATINDLSFNRRFHMKDGSVVFNPGFNNPDRLGPAAGIDPTCAVVLFRDAIHGAPFASLVNFALHLDTTGGTAFSADYPCFLSETLQERFGKGFVSVFGTGTCGDINHLDFAGGRPVLRAEQIGRELGKRVLETIDVGLTERKGVLNGAERIVPWPRQEFSSEQIAAAKADYDTVFDPANAKGKTFLERVEIEKIVRLSNMAPMVNLDVQAIRLADEVAVVTIPGEVFVDLGLAIKSESPFAETLVIELSQENLIYIPTKKAFREGSYETVNSVITPGGGERLVEITVDTLRAIHE